MHSYYAILTRSKRDAKNSKPIAGKRAHKYFVDAPHTWVLRHYYVFLHEQTELSALTGELAQRNTTLFYNMTSSRNTKPFSNLQYAAHPKLRQHIPPLPICVVLQKVFQSSKNSSLNVRSYYAFFTPARRLDPESANLGICYLSFGCAAYWRLENGCGLRVIYFF